MRTSGLILVILLAACGGDYKNIPIDDRQVNRLVRPDSPKPTSNWVIVGKGDTLYSIAFAHGHDFKVIAQINQIKPPYTIYPGQRLSLVVKKPSLPRSRSLAKPISKPPKRVQAKPAQAQSLKKQLNSPVIQWQWPTQGKIIRRYARKAPGKKGIGIQGKLQQTIAAAAAGQVVYAGSGLIGYGNLLIVKHDDRYLSAYAHNSKIVVKEGQSVQRGQKVALMGSNESNTPMLHFEIRKNGKPTNPISYLPKRQ